MPTSASSVAALDLPLAPGALNSAVLDTSVDGLLAYFAFWLQYDLNTKLANLMGTSADACPAANRFPWNPMEPSKTFVRGRQDGNTSPFPALYLWLDKAKAKPYTTIYDLRDRKGGILWVFDELTLPGGLVDRYGLRAAVEATIWRAASLARHPGFGLPGGPLGQPIDVALKLSAMGFWVDNAQQGFMSPITENVQGSDQPVVHAYPTMLCELNCQEQIEVEQALDSDMANDPSLQSNIGTGDPARPLAFGKHYLPGFDQQAK